jgi:cytochrome c2
MKISIALALLLLSAQSVIAATATIKTDRNSVDAACSSEGQIAKCGNDVVGPLLFKCIQDHKAANEKIFKISTGCKSAIDKLQADKKAQK